MEPASIERLAQTLRDDAAIGVTGPRIVNEKGVVDFSIRRLCCSTSTAFSRWRERRLWREAAASSAEYAVNTGN